MAKPKEVFISHQNNVFKKSSTSGNSDVFSLIVASETGGVNVGAALEWFELI